MFSIDYIKLLNGNYKEIKKKGISKRIRNTVSIQVFLMRISLLLMLIFMLLWARTEVESQHLWKYCSG